MKNTALVALLISGVVFSAAAQERGHRTPKTAAEIAQLRTDRMTEQLTLTEDQQQKVYALNLENAEKMTAERDARTARMKEMRKARAAKMKERRAKIKASQERLNEILTAEQRETLKQQHADRAEKMKMRKGHWDGRARGDRAKRGKRNIYKFHRKTDSTQATAPVSETTK